MPQPYALNYHFDNTGVFRGLAFANFRTPEETDIAVLAMNGYELSGRKLRVEYKKLPVNHRDKDHSEGKLRPFVPTKSSLSHANHPILYLHRKFRKR